MSPIKPELVSDEQRTEVVWRARANRLSQRPVVNESRKDAFPVVVLGLDDEYYAVRLSDVAEVLPPIQPTPVPGAAAIFAGVINVHGEIRPVIDLRRLLDVGIVQDEDSARVIMLRSSGRELGLRVGTVEQIRWLGLQEIQSTGDVHQAGNRSLTSRYVGGWTKDLLMLLNTETLFGELDTGGTN